MNWEGADVEGHTTICECTRSEGDFSGKSVLSLVHADSLKTVGRAVTQQGSDEIQVFF